MSSTIMANGLRTIQMRRESHLKDWVVQSLKVKRARIDIELVVDGNIVDLNRIPLPADTPIIDKRFKDKHNK